MLSASLMLCLLCELLQEHAAVLHVGHFKLLHFESWLHFSFSFFDYVSFFWITNFLDEFDEMFNEILVCFMLSLKLLFNVWIKLKAYWKPKIIANHIKYILLYNNYAIFCSFFFFLIVKWKKAAIFYQWFSHSMIFTIFNFQKFTILFIKC